MDFEKNKQFGQVINRIINKENLTTEESYKAFSMVLSNQITEMQQGAFLAALTGKGETADEVAGGWKAIYELDTNKVTFDDDIPLIDNCGTGMDSFKTFNISTAASIVAAAGDIRVARHGARAITSKCGTVDIAEALGVDMECDVNLVAKSIKETGIGLFNGMSPQVHPMALGRILSQIHFGSPLNIAASLANPALPKKAVRGVYSKELVSPVLKVMQSIGYTDVLVLYGTIDGSTKGMDEASVCGPTHAARLKNNTISYSTITPEEWGIPMHYPDDLAADSTREKAAKKMVALLSGNLPGARTDAVLLNTALIFLVADKVSTIPEGMDLAQDIISSGKAIDKLEQWVCSQNQDCEQGMKTLQALQAIGS